MRVVDLFAGTGSSTLPFEDRGHTVVKYELDPDLAAESGSIVADVLDLTPERILDDIGGPVHFLWGSPPCWAFSVASIGHHWTGGRRAYVPKTDAARDNQLLVAHTIRLAAALSPTLGWVMENPRGVLRKLPVVKGLPRATVTYCQYGDDRMKPTDLWGRFPAGWTPRPMCSNGDACHEAAPRGAKTGTQGRDGKKTRSMVPYELGLSLCLAAEGRPEATPGQMTLEESA